MPGRELELYVPASLRAHLAVGERRGGAPARDVAFVKLSGTDEVIADAGPDGAARAARRASPTRRWRGRRRYGITWLESDIDADACKLYLTAGAP